MSMARIIRLNQRAMKFHKLINPREIIRGITVKTIPPLSHDLIVSWPLRRDYRKSKVVLHSLDDSGVSVDSLRFHGNRIYVFVVTNF